MYGRFGVFDRGQLQDRYKAGLAVLWAVQMRPGVGALCLRVVYEAEDLNVAFPGGLALESFVDMVRSDPHRLATVHLQNRGSDGGYVVLFGGHSSVLTGLIMGLKF